jgi:hypothetical protein
MHRTPFDRLPPAERRTRFMHQNETATAIQALLAQDSRLATDISGT